MYETLQWVIGVAIRTLFVLVLAILVAWLWNLIVAGVLKGPDLSFINATVIMAIVSVGGWNVVFFRRRVVAPAP